MGKLLILLFSTAKLGKLLSTGGTMVFSMAAYSWIFGWPYAVGFVLLLFCHEMGHYIAAKQRGLDVGAPTFIPFVGAWIQMKDMPHNVETEAYVGFAGPIVGSVAAVVCLILARELDSELLLALAYSGFMLNLFNLIPVSPLDGGRITAIISPVVWLLGIPLLVALFFYHPSPMLLLIALLAYPQLRQAWHQLRHGHTTEAQQAYYSTPLNTRIAYGALYLGMIVALSVMVFNLHEQLLR
jgi:Zn-dependent protease